MKRLLVPIDHSEPARTAFRYALGLASHLHELLPDGGTTLTVLNAFALKTSSHFLSLEQIAQREREGAAEARKQLDVFVAETLNGQTPAFPVHASVRMGFALEEIISQADSRRYDMVVMGTRGANNLSDRVLGTNTLNVIRNVDIPVIVVPSACQWRPPQHIAHLADLRRDAIPAALAKSVQFARSLNARVSVYHHTLRGYDGMGAAATEAHIRSQLDYPNLQVTTDQHADLDAVIGHIHADQPDLVVLTASVAELEHALTVLQTLRPNAQVPVMAVC